MDAAEVWRWSGRLDDLSNGSREVASVSHPAQRNHLHRLQRRNERDQWVNFGAAAHGKGGTINRLIAATDRVCLMCQSPGTDSSETN